MGSCENPAKASESSQGASTVFLNHSTPRNSNLLLVEASLWFGSRLHNQEKKPAPCFHHRSRSLTPFQRQEAGPCAQTATRWSCDRPGPGPPRGEVADEVAVAHVLPVDVRSAPGICGARTFHWRQRERRAAGLCQRHARSHVLLRAPNTVEGRYLDLDTHLPVWWQSPCQLSKAA